MQSHRTMDFKGVSWHDMQGDRVITLGSHMTVSWSETSLIFRTLSQW